MTRVSCLILMGLALPACFDFGAFEARLGGDGGGGDGGGSDGGGGNGGGPGQVSCADPSPALDGNLLAPSNASFAGGAGAWTTSSASATTEGTGCFTARPLRVCLPTGVLSGEIDLQDGFSLTANTRYTFRTWTRLSDPAHSSMAIELKLYDAAWADLVSKMAMGMETGWWLTELSLGASTPVPAHSILRISIKRGGQVAAGALPLCIEVDQAWVGVIPL